jgi:hypothetical protein
MVHAGYFNVPSTHLESVEDNKGSDVYRFRHLGWLGISVFGSNLAVNSSRFLHLATIAVYQRPDKGFLQSQEGRLEQQ